MTQQVHIYSINTRSCDLVATATKMNNQFWERGHCNQEEQAILGRRTTVRSLFIVLPHDSGKIQLIRLYHRRFRDFQRFQFFLGLDDFFLLQFLVVSSAWRRRLSFTKTFPCGTDMYTSNVAGTAVLVSTV